MRADEHEGDLNSTENKRLKDQMDAEARRRLGHNRLALTESAEFLLWYAMLLYPLLVLDMPVNNGSTLAHFMGQRSLALRIAEEMEDASPGFLGRVLASRDQYDRDLRAAAQKEQ